MSALDDRNRWLAHLHECTLCPVNLCDRGEELAAAVRATMAHEESWEGMYAAPPRPLTAAPWRRPGSVSSCGGSAGMRPESATGCPRRATGTREPARR